MARKQLRRSVSVAPDVYGVAERSAARNGIPVSRWVTGAIKAHAHPDEAPELPPCPEGRCHRCGWPLAETRREGCRPGDCSQRPLPEPAFAPPGEPGAGPDGRPWRTG